MKLATATYRVIAMIRIDRPELRSKNQPAPAKLTSPFDSVYATRGAAIAHYDEIIRGEFDFGSEFVRTVEAVSVGLHSGRTYVIRKRIERWRAKTGRVYAIAV